MLQVVVSAQDHIMCIQTEREALLQFKAALLDHYGMLSSWTTSDCCQWQGILCSNLTGHVLMLHLSWNSFQGRGIPEFLGSLSNLRYLDLSYSDFGGKIPTQFGSLSHLKYLNLGRNSLEGSIPRQLGNLSQLLHLDLSYNSFEGSIPSQLGNLSNLQKLYLGGSYYESGALKIDDGDHWVSNLISLTHLSLAFISNLNTSHSFLQMIAKLPTLRELSLSECSLSDQFILSLRPSKFNFSSSLSILDLSWNSFTSSMILQWLSNVTSNLVELDLSGNLLEGSTSNHFGLVMNSLEHLDLSYNIFKGEDFKSLANICTLHSLYMPANLLSEDLPSILHNLSSGCVKHSLQELDFKSNQITGSLPDLSVFSSLRSLFLDGNKLSGKIPEGIRLPFHLEEGGIPKSFGNACALRSLDMSNNSLSEEFPMIIHHLSGCARYSLEQLYLRMNQINGTLPDLSIFSSLRGLYLYGNKLNGEIPKDIKFPPQLEQLDMQSNSLKGVLTDYHFANMSKLGILELSDNSLLALAFSQNWIPPFQLSHIGLRSCKLGPVFPKWLETQNQFRDIDISNAGIADMAPKWFWANLAFRERISMNISYNNLHGTIPNFPIKNIQYFLTLGPNQFDGPVPPFLRGSVFLDLSKNQFSDSLSFLCANGTVETLYELDLSNNHFSGKIPDCWSHFKSLTYLDLSHNNFSGRIPTSMGSLLHLQALLLRNNNLTDEIPFSLRSCTNLVMLDISENRLSGLIPAWIGSELQELQFLSLGRNNFHGSLPLQICYLSDIQLLDVSLNSMSGQIPKCIKNFTSMTQKTSSRDYQGHSYLVNTMGISLNSTYDLNALLMWKGSEQMFKNNVLLLLKSIDLSSNHFSGEIPLEIEDLFGLVSLNLSRNHLTGKIPSNIGKLTSLESLDLSRNQLVGSIPPSLTQIYWLSVLDLSHNHLTGKIPTSTQLQSFNASSYEDNLDLCGPPLEKFCIDERPTQKPNVEVQEDEYSLLSREFYMSMTFGFVISFWVMFGSILFKRSWRHAYFKFLNNLSNNIYVKVAVFASKISKVVVSAQDHIMCIQTEREALLQFKAAIEDPYGMLSSWTTSDCCQWQGIRCSNLTAHVLMLDLHGHINYSYAFNREIHKSLMELQQLNYLNLSSNSFQGRGIPEFLGSLTNLRYLDLSFSYFGGKIPTQFGSLSHLKYLDLCGNRYLQGSIPLQLGNLSQLQHLDLSANQFEGKIPSQLVNLSQLQHLDLSVNQFEGNIPSQIGNLSQLQHLDLSVNQFEGNIPSQIGNLSQLQHLDLSVNQFEGNIPSQIGNLSQLQHLDLSANHFEGNIPSQIGNLSQLQHLDLSVNQFEGNIPSQIGNLSQLQHLDLSYNSFEGSIPSQLGNLSNLQKLYLGGRALKIDDGDHWLSNLISLTHLSFDSISNLNTSHSFLQMIAKLPKLKELSLSNCSLSDHFILPLRPSKFNFSSSLSFLDLSINSFTSSMILQWLSNVTSNLVELDLSHNLLEGSTSNHFGRAMNSLEYLDLSYNIFKGEDLKSFANICTLHSLYMPANHLTEDLPSILHNLSSGCVKHSLQDLDFRYNQITGSLPDLSEFSSLRSLFLDGNKLSGKIPGGIRLPFHLKSLSIRSNSLEGGIPKSFGNSCALSSLDMSGNNLNKELSVIIHQLSGCARFSLQELNIGGNQINGASLWRWKMQRDTFGGEKASLAVGFGDRERIKEGF
ncbi:Receptor-like protein EIX2 [Glycine soja]